MPDVYNIPGDLGMVPWPAPAITDATSRGQAYIYLEQLLRSCEYKPSLASDASFQDVLLAYADVINQERLARHTESPAGPVGPQSTFLALLDAMRDTHERKSKDYGSDADRLANLNACTRMGIAPAQGVAIRMVDKMARIEQLLKRRYSTGQGPAVTNESLGDTAMDLAVYSLLLIELLSLEEDHADAD